MSTAATAFLAGFVGHFVRVTPHDGLSQRGKLIRVDEGADGPVLVLTPDGHDLRPIPWSAVSRVKPLEDRTIT